MKNQDAYVDIINFLLIYVFYVKVYYICIVYLYLYVHITQWYFFLNFISKLQLSFRQRASVTRCSSPLNTTKSLNHSNDAKTNDCNYFCIIVLCRIIIQWLYEVDPYRGWDILVTQVVKEYLIFIMWTKYKKLFLTNLLN